jgi:hypothetical protein
MMRKRITITLEDNSLTRLKERAHANRRSVSAEVEIDIENGNMTFDEERDQRAIEDEKRRKEVDRLVKQREFKQKAELEKKG